MGRYVLKKGIYRHIDGERFILRDVFRNSETGELWVLLQSEKNPNHKRGMPLSDFRAEIPEGTESDVNWHYMFELVGETYAGRQG